MVRTQIQLTVEQHGRLKTWADHLGISMSEAVRRCVEEKLSTEREGRDRNSLLARAVAVMGRYQDPEGEDVAVEHDLHLAESYDR